MTRRRAWQALAEAGLIARHVNGDVLLHDYLDYQPSRAKLLADRGRRAQTEQSRRGTARVAGHAHDPVPDRGRVPSRPVPSPSLSNESERERALAPESDSRPDPATETEARNRSESAQPPEVPGLVVAHPGPLQPSKRDQDLDAKAYALHQLRHKYPPDFEPTVVNQARALEMGLTEAEAWQRWDECRDKRYPAPFDDPVGQFNRELAWAKADKEKRMFKTRSERDAFEMPGRERRPA